MSSLSHTHIHTHNHTITHTHTHTHTHIHTHTHTDACLPGITRQIVMEIAPELGIKVEERNVSLAEVYSACEAFTTGTMGALVPVSEVCIQKSQL